MRGLEGKVALVAGAAPGNIGAPAGLHNSHQNGRPLFRIFVADPRTARLFKARLTGPECCRASYASTC